MTEKVHCVLDGELPASALSPLESELLAQTGGAVTAAVRGIPASAGVDLAPAVLARIRAAQPAPRTADQSTWVSALRWLWSPRQLSLQWRPAYAVAFAALLVFAINVANPITDPVATTPAQQVLVQFRLDAPNAHQVQLAGNFTSWKASVALKRSASGVWTVVLPLAPGVHNYAFVIDGNDWVADPLAQPVSDGFGGTNSQVAVLTPDNTTSL